MRQNFGQRVTAFLADAHPAVFSFYAIVAAFSTYFSMYAFRKPFAVGTFEGEVSLPFQGVVAYKSILIISQVLGYALSKMLGIKVISEMTPERRGLTLLGVIGLAHAALLLFAIIPAPYNAFALFLNGLPLGMVWGLTFGFLEGRRTSEALGAGLSASYILASGVVKSVGKAVLEAGYHEVWMPFLTGLVFLPFLVLFVWMLTRMPPPTPEDEAARTRREPMNGAARKQFFLAYLPGLLPLTVLYVLLTSFRDFRDNFARELWDALGYGDTPGIFAVSEVPIAFGVMVALGLLMVIKSNRTALIAVHAVMLVGTLMIGVTTWMFQAGLLDPALWMVLVGLGLYLAYVPYGCVLFDRLIAAVGVAGTAGFMIYLTDTFGYAGSVVALLYKDFGQPQLSWLEFFTSFSYVTSAVCTTLYLISMVYFAWLTRQHERAQAAGIV